MKKKNYYKIKKNRKIHMKIKKILILIKQKIIQIHKKKSHTKIKIN